jgi:hypothetical protein
LTARTSEPAPQLQIGDRVRIISSDSAYTGSRGIVAAPPSEVPVAEDGRPLGHYVAIDGENGRVRPFLSQELEQLRAARVRPVREVPAERVPERS